MRYALLRLQQAQIRLSDTDDRLFDRCADATRLQIEVLANALDAQQKERLAALERHYEAHGAFPSAAPSP